MTRYRSAFGAVRYAASSTLRAIVGSRDADVAEGSPMESRDDSGMGGKRVSRALTMSAARNAESAEGPDGSPGKPAMQSSSVRRAQSRT
jgi:hypothetical protein